MIPLVVMMGLGLAIAAGKKNAGSIAPNSNSAREDSQPDLLGLPIDPRLAPYVLETLISWFYSWGALKLPVPGLTAGANLKGLLGDCGELLYCLFREAGVFPADLPMFTSADYWNLGDGRFVRVANADIQPGDVICYPGHVAGCVGGSGLTCTVWSNSGGTQATHGDNPNARPKLFKGPNVYRKDFLGAVRLVK
ncbi:MAG: hypothetical protein EPO08_20655 [Rhodospirillaceae bacterium]|nr:MAG: hypothetical protein EPO08_20655 [Rhodospirillaceae bacterium]